MKKLFLASTSPRRKDILNSLGVFFCVKAPNFDEDSITEKKPTKKCILTARGKAENVFTSLKKENRFSDSLILAADTLIFQKNTLLKTNIFGKPKNEQEAEKMLRFYSGKYHSVVSAVCCIDTTTNKIIEKHNISKVFFKELSESEIKSYIKTEEWKDAAGGYKIQGKASFFIEKIEGSYSGIIGFPLKELYEILSELGVNLI